MAAAVTSQLEHLPNEVCELNVPVDDSANPGGKLLTEILGRFSTPMLLNLLTVSQRLHTLVLRVLHHRILYTWPLPCHGLILEAYHPSGKWTEPYLYCSYLGTTGGLSKSVAYDCSYADCQTPAQKCAKLRDVYSRFRPNRRDDESTRRRPVYGQMSVGGSQMSMTGPAGTDTNLRDSMNEKVEHIVNLDSHELFSQLCLSTSLVKLGPVSGVFPSVVEAAGGVIRVWRHWLREQAEKTQRLRKDEVLGSEKADGKTVNENRSVLWVDWKQDIGLQVSVREIRPLSEAQAPILEEVGDDDEERSVSYAIEIEEVLIRNSHLVLAIERSLEEQQNTSGKAMILGTLGSSPVAGHMSAVPV